jgi:hypothetical protein
MKFHLFFLTTVLFFSSFRTSAQRDVDLTHLHKVSRSDLSKSVTEEKNSIFFDTLIPDIFFDTCSATLFSFGDPSFWGFVGGTNEFIDLEKAQRFTYPASSLDVIEVFVAFSNISVVGDGEVSIKVYNEDPETGAPGELVGTSDPLNVSDLLLDPTQVLLTQFTFTEQPVVTTENFFLSLDISNLYESRDTLGILMTDFDCGDGALSWELFSDGVTWVSIEDSWNLESNYFFAAVVFINETTTSTHDVFNEIERLTVWPNPAQEAIQISYELERQSDVEFSIYGSDGRLVYRESLVDDFPGSKTKSIELGGIAAGAYFIQMRTIDGIRSSRILVGN